jgi:uncharacterized membrane protein
MENSVTVDKWTAVIVGIIMFFVFVFVGFVSYNEYTARKEMTIKQICERFGEHCTGIDACKNLRPDKMTYEQKYTCDQIYAGNDN